jgi:hypothetical protein
VARKAKICDLQAPAVVDEQVGGLHVAMKNVVVVEVAQTLEQLQHVALDLGFLELDVRVVEKAREVVVHVRRDHVQDGPLPSLGLGPLHRHLLQLQDVVVRQHLEQLDLPQRRDGKAVLFVVHEDLLHGVDVARDSMARLVHLSKSALAELLHHLVLADL